MRRYLSKIVAVLLVPVVVSACDRSTLGSTRSEPETRSSAVAADEEAHDHDFDHIDFEDVPDDKVEPELQLSAEEWRERLSDQEYDVLRENGTERAFSGELLRNKQDGTYVCGGCGEPLFSADTKFKSGTGWPSFYDAVEDGTVGLAKDTSHGMERVEVYCTHCGSHIGHVFNDGPAPTGLRYCVNSEALEFEPADADAPESEAVSTSDNK